MFNTAVNKNTVSISYDSEYRKVHVRPWRDQLVKDVALVYYAPGVTMPPHVHATAQFSTLISGQAVQSNAGSSVENRLGVAEFKPIDFLHANQIGPNGAVFISMNINAHDDSFHDEFGAVDWCLTETKYAKAMWQRIYGLLFNAYINIDVDLEELIVGLLSAAIPYTGKVRVAPTWLKRAQEALNDDRVSIDVIAQQVGVHRVHLCRVFQAHFGLSVAQYRQRLALQRSITSLLHNQTSIVDASAEAGFADQSHFTRTLKKHFGITPQRFKTLMLQ